MHSNHETNDNNSGMFAGPGRGRGPRFAWVMAAHEDDPEGGRPGRGSRHGFGPGGGRERPPMGFGWEHGGRDGHRDPGGRGLRGGGRRDGRAGRGDVRAAVLLLLADQPMHGYQLIQEIVERSGGVWTPSPGSVYPALQLLEDEGLVGIEQVDGRKTARLTPTGTEYVTAHRAELGSPWDDVGGGVSTEVRDLRPLVVSLGEAVRQVAAVGSREQAVQAAAVLTEARKGLYRILADDITAS